jgi:ABC-type glycerol-3-phosphate transport system permease component
MASVASTPGSVPSSRSSERFGKIGAHAIVLILCFVTVFPFAWMLSTAVKEADQVFTQGWNLLPESLRWANFSDAFSYFPVANWLWNSLGISALTTAGKILISVPAAYAFSRVEFTGRKFFFAFVLATMIVPGVVTTVPNYVMVSKFGWMDTWTGVILPSLPGTAFYVFLLRQNIMTMPQELVDAGRVDGASTFRILIDLIVPNIKPTIAVVTILSFLGAWNQYLWPLLILSDFESKTLATGMPFFTANQEAAQMWGPMMATATIAVLPPLIIYAIFQKQIINTFVNSGIKG